MRPKNLVQIIVGWNWSVDRFHEFSKRADATLCSNDSIAKVRWLLDTFGIHWAKQGQPIARMLQHLARRELKLRFIKYSDAIHRPLLLHVHQASILHHACPRLIPPF